MLRIFFICSKNNFRCILLDTKGKTLINYSAGMFCSKNNFKNSFFTIQILFNKVVAFFKQKQLSEKKIILFIKGFGKTRFFVHKLLEKCSFSFLKIYQVGFVSFNGCRKKKQRRL